MTVPWVLAQALARARSDAERGDAGRFAIIASTGGGLVVGSVVAAVATSFAGPADALKTAELNVTEGYVDRHTPRAALCRLGMASSRTARAAVRGNPTVCRAAVKAVGAVDRLR
ncbi:hypothetical protein [Streptomyces sp. NPDC055287]